VVYDYFAQIVSGASLAPQPRLWLKNGDF
jgi:hypothetical protein